MRRTDTACSSQDASYRTTPSIKQLSNLMESPARFPALLHQCLLTVGVIDSCPVLHLQHSFGLGRVIVCCIDRLNPPPEAVVRHVTANGGSRHKAVIDLWLIDDG